MTMGDKIILYNTSTSPYGHRILIALKLAGVEYESVSVDMEDRDWYRNDVYREGKVPALKYGDEVIPESMIIMEMLNELYPSINLFPTADPVKKAKLKFVVRLFEDQVLPITREFLANNPNFTKDTFDIYVEKMSNAFRRFNDLLLEQSPTGPYFLGTQYSAVDAALAPFFFQIISFMKFLTGKEYKVLDELPRFHGFLKGILDHSVYKGTAYLDDEKLAAISSRLFQVTKNMFADE